MINIKDNILKGLKFYSSVISKNIPVFMLVGLMSILFSESGFFPNNTLSYINLKIYTYVVPMLIAYTTGFKIGKENSAVVASFSGLCLAIIAPKSAIILSVFSGGLFGYMAKQVFKYINSKDIEEGFEMISNNIAITILCIISIYLTFLVISPISFTIEFLILKVSIILSSIKALPVLSVIIETLKVFFLNNTINHGLLIPAAMNTINETGKSILFLMETNPGPGFGLLLAYFFKKKEYRKFYSSCMTVQAVGGIHEIYFPIAASNPLTIIALIFGGMVGNFIFNITNSGAVGAISPGSIITILMMCKFTDWAGILLGIALSAFTSFVISYAIIKHQDIKKNNSAVLSTDNLNINNLDESSVNLTKNNKPNYDRFISNNEPGNNLKDYILNENLIKTDEILINQISSENSNKTYMDHIENNNSIISKPNTDKSSISIGYVEDIAFVCDLGMGSSVMASSIFKKKLEESGLKNICVSAYSIDAISEDSDLIICQNGFKYKIEEYIDFIPIIEVVNFMSSYEYDKIIEIIKNGG